MPVEQGQLRRWTNPDDGRDVGKVFMILGEKTEWDSRVTIPTGWRAPRGDVLGLHDGRAGRLALRRRPCQGQ